MTLLKLIGRIFREFVEKKNFFLFMIKTTSCNISVEIGNKVRFVQRTNLRGKGNIIIGSNVLIGINPSPYLKTTEIYIEARGKTSRVEIGDDVCINNNAVIIADKSKVIIGDGCLIGTNFTCYDSNFHSLKPDERLDLNAYSCKDTVIGKNVFFGSGVTVLRGSKIGDNSVVGAGCIISGEVPENSVVSVSDSIKIKELRS